MVIHTVVSFLFKNFVVRHPVDIQPLLRLELQTLLYKILALVRYYAFLGIGEVHTVGFQHYSFF